jgi:hypothetical protein
MLPVVCVLAVGCSSSAPSSSTAASESASVPVRATPSSAATPVPALVGRWQRTITCQQLVADLERAGLGALAPSVWLGQTSFHGPEQLQGREPGADRGAPVHGSHRPRALPLLRRER